MHVSLSEIEAAVAKAVMSVDCRWAWVRTRAARQG